MSFNRNNPYAQGNPYENDEYELDDQDFNAPPTVDNTINTDKGVIEDYNSNNPYAHNNHTNTVIQQPEHTYSPPSNNDINDAYKNNETYTSTLSYSKNPVTTTTNDRNDNDDFVDFMRQINDINSNLNDYETIINQIDNYHRSLLAEVNEDEQDQLRRDLDDLTSQATNLQYLLKDKIKNVQRLGLRDSSKEAQAEKSRQKFLKLIQDYRIIDSDYKDQNKEQAMRQYKIIQPDATDEEVEAAITDAGGQQIFSQALLNANRRGQAKSTLTEVQARHQELLQLEKTMAELTQLFNDMEQLVIEQQENIEAIDQHVENAQQDLEQGVGHTNKAVVSARKARKNKVRCYIIIAAIILVIIIASVVPSVVATQV
ncbi:hypothetical protein TBLA_0C02020 [Henningerozyma blattae CBS 6284]|uniref:t-SNARE coiled-coil homology domain-containing protein n=1 Tax=Henningerozyma blattae (strain ATCC 34711 / CBS 6284 / DSM 70876 / NBRC 10599 / NRRL Y-10934 / UCD 77-7) TaxID=1071380 RepID=I2H0W2_HENB6|nr:hypothetical protein TBLA_0C02020 [Tetrapisispora blattae CBS 6284]CCH60014.1 hypothetical protein TBLA_0C02020 [Tetrapisispora blattae CBS 6284]